MSKRYL